jgi:positive regulator of sigma E activity
MNTSETIVHDGRICKVENGIASVSFVRSSGCAGCSIRSGCGMAESTDAIIEIPVHGRDFTEGDSVTIHASATKGYLAILLAYCVPFVLVIAALVVSIGLGTSESVAGMISLATLIPYYVCLRIFSRFYKHELSIDILKNE